MHKEYKLYKSLQNASFGNKALVIFLDEQPGVYTGARPFLQVTAGAIWAALKAHEKGLLHLSPETEAFLREEVKDAESPTEVVDYYQFFSYFEGDPDDEPIDLSNLGELLDPDQ